MSRRWIAMLLPWLALVPLIVLGRAAQAKPDDTFAVNSVTDVNDAAVGDGLCETGPGNGTCTLRAALQEASAFLNPDTIILPAGTYSLTRFGYDDTGINGDLDVTGTVTLLGAGPAATIIDASVITDRVFTVFTGTVNIAGVTIQNGQAGGVSLDGGGLFNYPKATLTLSNTVVTGNRATGAGASGGGIANGGTLVIRNSTISSNSVSNASGTPVGAGIYSAGPLLLADSVVRGNTTSGDGGGLYAFEFMPSGSILMIISNSTFVDNRARYGGAIMGDGAVLRLANSTLSANQAQRAGGGIYGYLGNMRLHNVTVTGNFANVELNGNYAGGGVAKDTNFTFDFINSILAGNFRTQWSQPFPLLEDSDCAGTITSLGPNFVGATGNPCAVVGAPPLTGGFALLGPLADNGGPTPTHALLPGSPAIDAGAQPHCLAPLGTPLTRDQRGTLRPLFGRHSLRCDLGAYELAGPLFVPFVQH